MLKRISRCLQVFLLAGILGSVSAEEAVVIKGSDTIGSLLIPHLIMHFPSAGGGLNFEVSAEGTSTGVISVIDGLADIAMASRPISDREWVLAQESGVHLISMELALDGIAIIVNEDNPVQDFSVRELEMLFCGDIRQWSYFEGDFERISLYTRHTASGTYAYFQNAVMRRRDYSASSRKMAGNEQIAIEVAKNRYGIGYTGMMQTFVEGVKAVKIDGVFPSKVSIRNGDYPLVRTLYLVYREDLSNPNALKFLRYCSSEVGKKVINRTRFIPSEN